MPFKILLTLLFAFSTLYDIAMIGEEKPVETKKTVAGSLLIRALILALAWWLL